jgi:hypothetical protein
MAGEAAKQTAQILAPSLAEIGQQLLQLVRRKRRGFGEASIVAVLSGQHGKGDAPLARHRAEGLYPVAPPVEATEQPDHDHLGVLAGLLDPKVDRHRVTQVAQMREPYTRKLTLFQRVGGSEPGKIAVGERQHHDVARRLGQVEGLDDVVERG